MTGSITPTAGRRSGSRATSVLRPHRAGVLIAVVLGLLIGATLAGPAAAEAATPPSPSTSAPTTTAPGTPMSPAQLSADPLRTPSPAAPTSIGAPEVPASLVPAAPREGEGGDCGLLDFVCPVIQGIDRWFKDLVISALSPVVDLIGQTVLTTPDVTGVPQVIELWQVTRWIANTVFVLFVVAGGLVIASHETLQTRYALREVAPRIVVGLVAVNLSVVVIGHAITAVNAVSTAVLGQRQMGDVTTGIKAQVTDLVDHGAVFVIFIALVLLVLAVILLALYVVRIAITVIVIVAGPLALVCHASPYSEGVAKLWWRALIGILLIQVFQAITLIVFIKALFQQDSARPSTLLGPANGLMNLIICCVLLGILIKIPSWVMRHVGLGGRSAIASVIKFALLAKGLGMLGLGVKGAAGRRALAGAAIRRGRGGGGPASPPPGPSSPRPEPTGPSTPPPSDGGHTPTSSPDEQDTANQRQRRRRRDGQRETATERAREAANRAWSPPYGNERAGLGRRTADLNTSPAGGRNPDASIRQVEDGIQAGRTNCRETRSTVDQSSAEDAGAETGWGISEADRHDTTAVRPGASDGVRAPNLAEPDRHPQQDLDARTHCLAHAANTGRADTTLRRPTTPRPARVSRSR